jgi:hypothetical protein
VVARMIAVRHFSLHTDFVGPLLNSRIRAGANGFAQCSSARYSFAVLAKENGCNGWPIMTIFLLTARDCSTGDWKTV